MKNDLLNQGANSASLLPDRDGSPRPGKVAGGPTTNLKSSLVSWCAPVIGVLVVIMMGFAVAAILLGDK